MPDIDDYNEIVTNVINLLAEIPKLLIGGFSNVLTRFITLISASCKEVSLASFFIFVHNTAKTRITLNEIFEHEFVAQKVRNFDLVSTILSDENLFRWTFIR